MIDYIVLDIGYLDRSNLRNKFDFISTVDNETGEVIREIAPHLDMKIIMTPKNILLKGSLHKSYNLFISGNNSNSSLFDFPQLVLIIEHLIDSISLKPEKTIIRRIEYGININVSESPSTMIKEKILYWKNMLPSSEEVYNKGVKKKFEKTDYYFKIYDKSAQEGGNTFIIRLEKGIKNNRHLNRDIGVQTLNDLLSSELFKKMIKDLILNIQDLLILDTINIPTNLNIRDQYIWELYTNPINFIKHNKNKSSKKKRIQADRITKLVSTSGRNNIKSYLVKEAEKLENLHYTKFTQTKEMGQFSSIYKEGKKDPIYQISMDSNEISKCTQFDLLWIQIWNIDRIINIISLYLNFM